MEKKYKELKNQWYNLRKRRLYYEADQIKHKLKQWQKTQQR